MIELPPLVPSTESPALDRLLRRVERQIEQKRYREAIASLQRAIGFGVDEYACNLHLASVYRLARLWDGAFGAVERAIALMPRSLTAHEMLITVAIEAGDCDRVLAAGRALIRLMPRNIQAHNALGAIYMQRGEVEAAMRVANTLIRLEPDIPAHHFKKALLCQHQGEVALAVQEFSSTIRLDPDGFYAAPARDALENLDAYQINQIMTLAMEDVVFCVKLNREPVEAASKRGFVLSDTGCHILGEICANVLPETIDCRRVLRYN